MSTLFISHSSSDAELALELSRRLAEPPRNHRSVFLDLDPEQGIVAGRSWEHTLYRKLRACRAVIALCTDHYLRSRWCFAEVALARMEGKRIFALKADPLSAETKMPSILTEKQFIDLRADPEEAYQRLWRGLEELDLLGAADDWDPRRSPYLGLSAYDEKHAPVFFGRDDEIRAGIELLDRGAPGLVMVLGASGSGKSSMVRAGIVPRLRREADRWLIVGPFRPRRAPFAEAAEAFARAYRRYAPEAARGGEARERLRALGALGSGARTGSAADSGRPGGGGQPGDPLEGDERLSRLLKQLEELRRSPPEAGGSPLREFLDWSLDDLKRICGEEPEAGAGERRRRARGADAATLLELAEDLRRASGHRDARVLLVIDQFEELLGHDDARDDANRFLSHLRGAFESEHSPLMVLGTMRSDFLGLFQRNRALLGVDFESLSVGPMHVEGMRRVIEEPARLGAIELERGLADRLLADTETPDALPLLSFTMSVLWRGREDGRVSVRQYEALDGLHGAIAREAEAVLDSARRQGREDDVRRAFLQMARLTEDGNYARKAASWDREELRQVRPILEEFEKRRLLVTRMERGEERTVEVAHEALFRSWAPLEAWLDDHRAVLMLRAQLRRDAQAWEESHRAADRLWHGGRLQQAEDLLRKGELGGAAADGGGVGEFVRQGVRRRRRRRGAWAGVTALVFAVVAGAAVVAWQQRQLAASERDEALRLQSLFLADAAVEQLSRGDAVTAVLLGLEGLQDPGASEERQRVRPYVHEAKLSLESAWSVRRERVVLVGHDDLLFDAAFSPDGTRVVTASSDKTARVWNAVTGDELFALRGHGDWLSSAAFSPDGTRIVTTSGDTTARVWDPSTRGEVSAFMGHDEIVWKAAFSGDGNRVVSASSDGTARVWDAATGESLVELRHPNAVFAAAFSPDGSRVVTASTDKARVWDLARREVVTELGGHISWIVDAVFSPDGRRIVTASRDHTARLWDAATGDDLVTLTGHEDAVWTAAFTPDGARLVTASEDASARLWDAQSGLEIHRLVGHGGGLSTAAFSTDGTRVVTSAGDNTARVWDALAGEAFTELGGHQETLWWAGFGPSGARILTASADRTAWIWDLATGRVVRRLSHGGSVNGAAFSPDGSHVATAVGDNTARIWDLGTGAPARTLSGHDGLVSSIAYNHDGTHLVTASADQTARLWDAVTGTQIHVLEGHQGRVNSAAFSPSGDRVVTASADRTVRIWEVDSGAEVATATGHDGFVYSAAFSPDGTRVVSASQDETARIWDAATARPVAVLSGHDDQVWRAAFSPDGTRVVTASQDKAARVWDAAPPYLTLKVLRGHEAAVTHAAFNRTGTLIVTASRDKTARVWDASVVERQALIGQIKEHVPRCLTLEQRRQFFLAPQPPYWCVETSAWPFQADEWKEWLAATRMGREVELPETAGAE